MLKKKYDYYHIERIAREIVVLTSMYYKNRFYLTVTKKKIHYTRLHYCLL